MSFKFDGSIYYPKDKVFFGLGSQQFRQYEVKYEICRQVAPKKIAEIGVRAGYSGWTFLQACPDAEYIGFDAVGGDRFEKLKHWHGASFDPKTKEPDMEYAKWAISLFEPYNAKLICMDTQKVDSLEVEGIDLFHVDGDHSFEGCHRDLDLASRTLSPGGCLLVDDYDYLKTVRRAVDTWIDANKEQIEQTKYFKSFRGEMLVTMRR